MGVLSKLWIGALHIIMPTTLILLLREIYRYSRELCARRAEWEEEQKRLADAEAGKLDPDIWNTALFFPDYFPERPGSTTQKLLWFINQARESVDVCAFCINFPLLKTVLKEISGRGVWVRVLTNGGNPFSKYDAIRHRKKRHSFRNTISGEFNDLMHHKFIIIDKQAVMTGSLNWTQSGVTENNENMAVTTDERVVEKYREEFRRLWIESRPRREGALGYIPSP